MENYENGPVQPGNSLILTDDARQTLKVASTWAKFISIIGFIGTALIVLAALAAFVFTNVMSDFSSGAYGGYPGGFQSIIRFLPGFYLIAGVIYFLISLYLYRFASHIKQAVVYNQQHDLYSAFNNLKSYFKTIGILVIVAIVFYLIAIVVGIGMFAFQQY